MDEIFHKVHGFRGAFDVVKVAREMPHRYGKSGELLIPWEETEEAREVDERRRSSVAAQGGVADAEKGYGNGIDRREVEDGK